jgi:hypothetical protein
VTDRSAFTDDEWAALTEAPLRITLALVAVGEHGPISVLKETAASARATARPTERGPADDLIAQIARAAESREARHDVKAHLGRQPQEVVTSALADLEPAASALGKLSAEESAEVRAWFLDIAQAVAAAAKSVTPQEQDVLTKLQALFGAPPA